MELTWGDRKCLYGAHLAEMQNDFMELTQGDRNFTELSQGEIESDSMEQTMEDFMKLTLKDKQ